RAGRDHQAVHLAGGQALRNLVHGDLVVAHHGDLGAELPQVLHDVEGEGVVVVHHQDFDRGAHSRPSSTSSAARNSARALCSVSFHSISGTESATTPAAACT